MSSVGRGEDAGEVPPELQEALGILAERVAEELALAEPDWERATGWVDELHRRWPRRAG